MFKDLIKQYAVKSMLIRRAVRWYRSKTGYPDWNSILNTDKVLWESATHASNFGPKILIATSTGAHLPSTILESLLGVALTLRKADVHFLLCDSVLPACLMCDFTWYRNHNRFVTHQLSKTFCKTCFSPAYKIYQSIGIPIHRYSEYLTNEDYKIAEDISSTLPIADIDNYSFDNMAVGEHALAGALRFYARGTLEGEPYAEHVLRQYLKASLLTTFAIRNLFRKYRYECVVFNHGIYVPQGLIGEVCRQEEIRVVNWNPAYRKNCFIFSHRDTYHHTMMSEPVEKWINMPWNEKLESELMDYLRSRWKGTRDWIWFHEKPQFELQEIAREFDIDLSKPCIGMLTSVMWDAVLHYPSNAFLNMLDWILRTIDYFTKRPDLQLIIRVHPAEIRGTLPSRQKVADEVKNIYHKLPKNIVIIPPASDASTYAVMSHCDAVIIYNTKTGVELSAMGIPIIVAGEAWIRNKGFAMDVDNPESYFKLLDKLPFKRRMSPEDSLKAKKYAYHFFFRRMIPLEFMKSTSGWPPYSININRLSDLTSGKSTGLDIICEAILNGKDFIYHAER